MLTHQLPLQPLGFSSPARPTRQFGSGPSRHGLALSSTKAMKVLSGMLNGVPLATTSQPVAGTEPSAYGPKITSRLSD